MISGQMTGRVLSCLHIRDAAEIGAGRSLVRPWRTGPRALFAIAGLSVLIALAPGGRVVAQDKVGLVPVPRDKPVAEAALSAAVSDCARKLEEAGVVFRAVAPPEPGLLGCRIDDPVRLERIGDARLRPSATLSCTTALKLVRFLQRPLKEEVRTMMNTAIATVRVAASYDCRGRNRQAGAKLSEHGYGRAIDIRGLTFANGEDWAVSPRDPKDTSPAAKFQRRVRALACGPFTTVLGPGSDAYHDDHFHFDLAPRNNAYCR
ncbi:extensin family protein [Stappia sp. ES.058]|uniref:extensin-like domain-containing protein n=1 Tax=Stappia sp. ES.058 TaxID=1881061 RepID=UPI000879B8B0|nr:extensin family protein [Stappia sp. ES.058]SDU03846.1 Extensin-like protein C-terminus [Stappia sp. ES.058]